MIDITILDYGMGNIKSVSKAFEVSGARVYITNGADNVLKARALVLPGVGAFSKAVAALKEKNLFETLKQRTKDNRLTLGICLGHQLLFDYSTEYGVSAGLKAIEGGVVRFEGDVKIPHMGWNSLNVCKDDPIFSGLPKNPEMYFVHSYYAVTDKNNIIATCNYMTDFSAAVRKGNIYGLQFHPEKSGENGLKIIKNFIHEVVKKC